MRPANHRQATQQMHALLIQKLPGRRKTAVNEHLKRAKQIAIILWQQYNIGPYQYQAKHLQYYLMTQITHLKPASQYRYWLTIKRIIHALDKDEYWCAYLQGPWRQPHHNTDKYDT